MGTSAPSPTSSSLVQAYHFYRRPLAYFEECGRRYGDNFTCRIPTFPAPITFVSDPDAIKEIFAADGTDLLETGAFANPIMAPVIGEHSMLVIDGAEHRRHRGLIMPYFMRGQFSKFGDTILRLTEREIASWPDAERFPVRPKMREITLQVMLNLVFGEERAMTVISPEVIREFFGRDPSPMVFIRSLQRDLGPLTPWRSFVHLRTEIYRGIVNEMAHRRTEPAGARNDVLAALMEARDEIGAGLAEQEILDEVLTMVLAGNDTTATALAWAVYYIFRDPAVLGELRDELDGAGGDVFDQARIVALPYLDATVKEVLRIAPIFLFAMRRLTRAMRLGKTEFAANTILAPCIYLVHHREDLWDQPERFNPRRFVDARHPSHHFFPFGGGTRHCVGAALATYEMKLVLSRIVLRADLRLDDGYVARAKWIANFIGPSKGVPVRFARRASSALAASVNGL
jgi:cytochrome P450